MALLANGLETLEVGATAWRLIINATIAKLYSRTEADSTFVAKAGSTMTGLLLLSANPSANLGAATKQYVDTARNSMITSTLSTAFTPTMGTAVNYYLTLTASITINNPTGHVVGSSGKVIFKQDATGGRVVTWGTQYKFAGGVDLVLSTAPNAIDCFDYFVLSSTEILITASTMAMA
jgi:hypothetical protein